MHMAGIQKWSTILLSAILLFTAVCFTAEADGSAGTPYEAGGNGSAATFFYVESAGNARVVFAQEQGLCNAVNSSGMAYREYEWGKYHITAEIPNGGNLITAEWNSSADGAYYTLFLSEAGTYRIWMIPYGPYEMQKSGSADHFTEWITYPTWWIHETRNCVFRGLGQYVPAVSEAPAQPTATVRPAQPTATVRPPEPRRGRLVTPYGWDTQFQPGGTGAGTYNDQRYLKLGNLTDDNYRTSFDWLIWSAERTDDIPELTAYFSNETISSIGIRNGCLVNEEEYWLSARATGLKVTIHDQDGAHPAYLEIPDVYTTEYRVFPLGNTWRGVNRIDLWLDTYHCDQSADIGHRYVIHISDLQFYE